MHINNKEARSKSHVSRKYFTTVSFVLLCSFFCHLPAAAQCAMCRAALESEGNGVKAEAVNDGIVYLMVIPYLLVAGIGYAIYRMNKAK